MVRYRAASAMAPIPFDRHGVPGTIELLDDFVFFGADITVTSTGGAVVSELPWVADAGTADSGTISIVVAESDHQGIINVTTTSTTPSASVGIALRYGNAADAEADEAFILDTNGLYLAAVLRVPSITATEVSFGLGTLLSLIPNVSVADEIMWTYDPSDTAALWIAQVNGAGTDVEKISTITYAANDWVLLEIAADSSGVIFRITTEDDTETININSADGSVEPVVALRPCFLVSPDVDATLGQIDIDVFALRYMRRQPLVASWLGA